MSSYIKALIISSISLLISPLYVIGLVRLVVYVQVAILNIRKFHSINTMQILPFPLQSGTAQGNWYSLER